MLFTNKYYVGETVRNKEKVVKRLISNHPYINIYCICLESFSHNLMTIFNSKEMNKDIYRYNDYKIIGIANGKKEAFELSRRIVENVYEQYGDPIKIREFFALE